MTKYFFQWPHPGRIQRIRNELISGSVIQDYGLPDSAQKNYLRIRNTGYNADPSG
jgi:hypothetical protein